MGECPIGAGTEEPAQRAKFQSGTMSFDKDSTLPIIEPRKPATQVNFSIVVAIVLFLAVAAGALWWISKHSPSSSPPSQGPSSSNP